MTRNAEIRAAFLELVDRAGSCESFSERDDIAWRARIDRLCPEEPEIVTAMRESTFGQTTEEVRECYAPVSPLDRTIDITLYVALESIVEQHVDNDLMALVLRVRHEAGKESPIEEKATAPSPPPTADPKEESDSEWFRREYGPANEGGEGTEITREMIESAFELLKSQQPPGPLRFILDIHCPRCGPVRIEFPDPDRESMTADYVPICPTCNRPTWATAPSPPPAADSSPPRTE